MLSIVDFLASMPQAYRQASSAESAAEHAAIVARRLDRLAHAELCKSQPAGMVCVVSDDRPGLLSLVTEALLVHGLPITSAQAYCRTLPGRPVEAVDFLELGGRVQAAAADIEAFSQTLTELISEDILASSRPSAPLGSEAATPTRVYFELGALARGEHVLLVEAPDSQGLLFAITSALHGQGVRIASCQVATVGAMARDSFELALSAGQCTAAALCDIQLAVLRSLPQA
jgi:UTP:GlnB (protein PII) uridylyltransferase